MKGPLFSGLVSHFIAITHYGQYSEFVESLNLAATFKDHKEGVVNIDRKNGGVDINGEDVKDDERNNEDSAIATKFFVDPDANIVNSKEADKGIRDIISAFLGAIGKRVSNADKGKD